jgi:hypothetical protein
MNEDGTPYTRRPVYPADTPIRLSVINRLRKDGLSEQECIAKIEAFEKERADEERSNKESYLARNGKTWERITRYRNKATGLREEAERYASLAAKEHSDLQHREWTFVSIRQKQRNAKNAAAKLAHEEATAKRKREDEEDTALENSNPR